MSPPVSLHIRKARVDEFDQIGALAQRAFIHDPQYNYFGCHKKLLSRDVNSKECQNLEIFMKFILTACYRVGGRIMVAVKHVELKEVIVGSAWWMPPRTWLSPWSLITLLRSGIIQTLRRWGITGLMRSMFEHENLTNAAMLASYKERGVKEPPSAAWFLELMMTDPVYEGQGIMSALMHEAFANASPRDVFALDSSTTASRDRYLHLGFEVAKTLRLGKGKVDALGLSASGKAAVGIEYYFMLKWDNTHKTNGRNEDKSENQKPTK